MKRIITVALAGALILNFSSSNISAMDSPPPILPLEGADSKKLEEIFQQGILEFAQKYNYGVPCQYASRKFSIFGTQIAEAFSYGGFKIDNPEEYRQTRSDTLHNHPLPSGDYIASRMCAAWMQTREGSNTTRHQGFKLHVSAKPETALQIANIVLPILLNKGIHHKVVYDLRYMRFLYNLSQYENKSLMMPDGSSSQAGKFIVIYPNNQMQAREIAQEIDKAFKAEGIGPDSFVKLPGDAQVGDTGGIFVRYGKFKPQAYKKVPATHVAIVDELEQSLDQAIIKQHLGGELPIGMPDERVFPWPDYMNNKELYKGPFLGNLNITWVSPYNPTQVVTWENRPNCWAELKGEQCLQPHENQNQETHAP